MSRKLIIIIPCLNEENTLPDVLNSIPKKIDGIGSIETLIIDDGSTDRTAEIAKELGVTYILKNTTNRGLAKSFSMGLNSALFHGADIIVNTDGDNQYPQSEIERLVQPIIEGKADIVIGDRQTNTITHFSPLKKLLQRLGSNLVCKLSGVKVPDAVSGFRAYSRFAAMELNVVTEFSYCTETIIQAGKKRLKIVSIPVITNAKTRDSRLFKNNWQHMKMTGSTMVRVFAMYEPLKTFFNISLVLLTAGSILLLRYLIFAMMGDSDGHLQSIIIGAVIFLAGFQILVLGLIADLIKGNRKLLEELLYQQRRENFKQK